MSCWLLKFIYLEKATKFCEIFTLLLTTVHNVKSKMKISQNFVAFSEYMNFNFKLYQLLKPFNTGHKTTTMVVEHGSMRLRSQTNFDRKFQFKWVFLIKMQLHLILQVLARSNYTVR